MIYKKKKDEEKAKIEYIFKFQQIESNKFKN